MGYITNTFANITEPAQISLGGNPNYVQIEIPGNTPAGTPLDITFQIKNNCPDVKHAILTFLDNATKTTYTIKGTLIETEVNNSTFYLHPDSTIAAQNIWQCMMNISFLKNNFDITIPAGQNGQKITNGNIIRLLSKPGISGLQLKIKEPLSDFCDIRGTTQNIILLPIDYTSKFKMGITFTSNGIAPDGTTYGDIIIREKDTPVTHTFQVTRTKPYPEMPTELGINTTQLYSLSENIADNVRTIFQGLQLIPFFNKYYNISLINSRIQGDTILIQFKEGVSAPDFYIDSYDTRYIRILENIEASPGISAQEIQLDIYKNTNLFPGQEDTNATGTYLTTLSKAYFNPPLWFDINNIAQKIYSDSFLNAVGWCDAGTAADYRFVAKHSDGINTQAFYLSDALYMLTGNLPALEKNDLSPYVYDTVKNNTVKPLTRQPRLTYLTGQTQYFNFILSDPLHTSPDSSHDFQLGIQYKLYTQSGVYIGKETVYQCDHRKLHVVNTIRLNIDQLIARYNNVGRVEAYLSRNGTAVSTPLVFDILPSCLYKLNDFAFLNSLGGWSAFNFGGTEQTDFKTETTTIFKTQTPDHRIHSQIESVYKKEAKEQFIAQTLPLQSQAAQWLKELSSSIAVYELSTKRYIIVEELNIKHSTKNDLFTLQMKYHYSDM